MEKIDLSIDDLEHQIRHHYTYDISRTDNYNKTSSTGWKLSIQGKTVEDGVGIYNSLIDLLNETQTPYKLASHLRFSHYHPEQSKKAMTIYVRDDVDVKEFAEKVSYSLKNYTGYEGIEDPTSYTKFSDGVYYRNDRDINGQYVTAN